MPVVARMLFDRFDKQYYFCKSFHVVNIAQFLLIMIGIFDLVVDITFRVKYMTLPSPYETYYTMALGIFLRFLALIATSQKLPSLLPPMIIVDGLNICRGGLYLSYMTLNLFKADSSFTYVFKENVGSNVIIASYLLSLSSLILIMVEINVLLRCYKYLKNVKAAKVNHIIIENEGLVLPAEVYSV